MCVRDSTSVDVGAFLCMGRGGSICRSISDFFCLLSHTHLHAYTFPQFIFVHSFRVYVFFLLNVVIFPLHFYTIKYVCHGYGYIRIVCATYFFSSPVLTFWLYMLVCLHLPLIFSIQSRCSLSTFKNAFGGISVVSVMIVAALATKQTVQYGTARSSSMAVRMARYNRVVLINLR